MKHFQNFQWENCFVTKQSHLNDDEMFLPLKLNKMLRPDKQNQLLNGFLTWMIEHRILRVRMMKKSHLSDFERDIFVNLSVSETVESSTEFTENSLKKTKYPVSVRSLGTGSQ